MNKKQLVEKLKELGLKGNIQESKKVLEERLHEHNVASEIEVAEIIEVEEEILENAPALENAPFKPEVRTFVGYHPVTREKVYR